MSAKLDETVDALSQIGLDTEFDLREVMREGAVELGMGDDALNFIIGTPGRFAPEVWFKEELTDPQHADMLKAEDREGIALYFYILGAAKGNSEALSRQVEVESNALIEGQCPLCRQLISAKENEPCPQWSTTPRGA